MLAPTPASPESAGMSKAAFDRLEDHLKQRYIDAGRFPGTQVLVYRRGKVVHSDGAGLCRRRAQGAGEGRHHFPHLFDDQADHQRGLHDAVRGRPRRARRARPQIHPGMEEPRRFPGRHRAGIPDPAAVAADADRRPAAAHFRPDLRLPAALQRRCRLSRDEDRRGREGGHAAIDDRGPGENPAGIFAGRGLELFGLHRRDRLPDRQDQRQAVRTVSEGAHLRSARHERHRLLRAAPTRPIVSRPATRPTRKAA